MRPEDSRCSDKQVQKQDNIVQAAFGIFSGVEKFFMALTRFWWSDGYQETFSFQSPRSLYC